MKTCYMYRSHIILSWIVLSLYICRPTLGHNSINNSTQCLDREREALLHFKHGITNDVCGLLTYWGRDADCCQWSGVHCSKRTGHVIALRLQELVGDDSSDIRCLQGKVSPSLGELKHLKLLNLSFNEFYGEIPHQLGNLSKLTTLDLGFSHSDLHVKTLQWISRLRLLRYLDLSGGDLSEVTNWMTIVNNLSFLSVLRMDGCQLPPKIPSSLTYTNISNTLHSVSLSANNFTDSSIFLWLFNLPGITTRLVYLDLSDNTFQGPIPSEFENFHSLSYLSLSNNKFQGSVFKVIAKLCSLQQLYLGTNNFIDELANVIQAIVRCENRALLTLDLSHNRFWGAIPDSISSLSSLRELYLDDNQLNSEITQGIGQLSMLKKLDISSNSLEGTLTHTHLLTLSRLRELYLSNNPRLVINIDANWIPPFQLDVISLRSCKLGPHFPKWLLTQTDFSYLDVSKAEISDNIPVSFFSSLSSNLQYLNMSYNKFYGILPNLPEKLGVFEVDLSSNLFEGVIPSGFTNVESLYLNDNRFSDPSNILCPKTRCDLSELDLSNNLFSGELPDCWMNLDILSSLHLENNRFSGHIPKSIGTLKYLQYLHLHNNSFSGPFPEAFENITSLIILNLGYNFFEGYIPPWIGNALQTIGALILRRNNFIGEIPVSLCQLANLQILDVGINKISGAIPYCIGNFTAMSDNRDDGIYFSSSGMTIGRQGITTEEEFAVVSWKREEQIFKETVRFVRFIDLSGNKLTGEIPDGISSLITLGSLDLSENELSGNIPSEVGNLINLELLDLSDNHLTGAIPVSLARVSSLGILDVSNNNLSGEIPVSTQLQSFNASSYMGNRGLCGAPLRKCQKDQAPSNVLDEDNISVEDEHDDFDVFPGLYICVVLGFIVGFWGVYGTLAIKRSLRHAYFRLLQDIKNRLLGRA